MINTKAANKFQKAWKLNYQRPVCSNIPNHACLKMPNSSSAQKRHCLNSLTFRLFLRPFLSLLVTRVNIQLKCSVA